MFVLVFIFAVVQMGIKPSIDNLAVHVIIDIAVITPIIYLLVFNSQRIDHYKLLKTLLFYSIPLLALFAVGLFIYNPQLADWLSYEDFVVESVTAAVACIAAVIITDIGLKFALSKSIAPAIVALLIALCFFVIGMEEISWGQRIFRFDSGAIFLEHNMQAETNLHNFNTHLMMNAFYIVTFIIFIVIPFYRKIVSKLLEKIRLQNLAIFIPSKQIVIIFASSIGFTALNYTFHTFMFIFTLFVLVNFLFIRQKDTAQLKPVIMLTMLAIALLPGAVLGLVYGNNTDIRWWFYSEWKEMFICLAMLAYAIDLAFRTRKPKLLVSSNGT